MSNTEIKENEVKQNVAENEVKKEEVAVEETISENETADTPKKSKKILIISIIIGVILVLAAVCFVVVQIPFVKINGEAEEVVSYGKEYVDKGIEAYTKLKSINDKVEVVGKVDTNKLGKYEIIYKVPYFNKYKEYKRIVTVVDDEKPVLTLNGDENTTQSFGIDFSDPGVNAKDNHDGDITDKVTTEKIEIDDNNYKIAYKVTDSSGNKSIVYRYIKIVDNVAPEITLNGESVVWVLLGGNYNELGATANDNKDGDVTENIKTSGEVDTSKEGVYLISYEVTDKNGNKSLEQRKVIVNPAEKAGIIYLTFDDGPSQSITPYILDILKEKGVHATFFILNYSDENSELVKRELEEGNSIGIHGYSHSYEEVYSSLDACYDNIIKLQDKIRETTGKTVKIIRFPGGSSNTVSKNYTEGIMTDITQKVLAEGFKYYDWNVTSGDAGGAKTKEEVYDNVTTSLKHGKSNVVLMHDFGGNTKTLEALPEIIDFGLENGYLFDVITEDTPMVTHPIAN